MKLKIFALVFLFTTVPAHENSKCTSHRLLGDPSNCEIFYSCSKNGIATRHFCPPDQIFNPDRETCDYPKTDRNCEKRVEDKHYRQCHPFGYTGCKTYPGPSDTKCCGLDTACYNFGGHGGVNQCVKKRLS